MKANNIFLFTRGIQTGKTTELLAWLRDGIEAGGVVTPDVAGSRKLYDVARKEFFEFQIDTTVNATQIGKFLFSNEGFALGRKILLDGIVAQHEWLILDELGKLELFQHSGFEPAVSQVISKAKSGSICNLLIVVRDGLLQQAIEYYGLEDAIIVHQLDGLR